MDFMGIQRHEIQAPNLQKPSIIAGQSHLLCLRNKKGNIFLIVYISHRPCKKTEGQRGMQNKLHSSFHYKQIIIYIVWGLPWTLTGENACNLALKHRKNSVHRRQIRHRCTSSSAVKTAKCIFILREPMLVKSLKTKLKPESLLNKLEGHTTWENDLSCLYITQEKNP